MSTPTTTPITTPFQDWPQRADAIWLTPDLALGSDHSHRLELAKGQALDLISQGVTHVLDCRDEASDHDLWEHFPEVCYTHLGIPDDGTYDDALPDSWYAAVLAWAEPIIAEGGKLFVHCHMGVNRAPTAAWLILVAVLGYSPGDAYHLIRTRRPVAYGAYIPGALEHLAGQLEAVGAADDAELVELVEDLDFGRNTVPHLMAGVPVREVNDAIYAIGHLKWSDWQHGDRRS